jgi:hypothetical protein
MGEQFERGSEHAPTGLNDFMSNWYYHARLDADIVF